MGPDGARTILLQPLAREDLADISQRTSDRYGEDQADRYIADLHEAMALTADNPRLAPMHTEFRPPVRLWRSGSQIIIFTADDERLIVMCRHPVPDVSVLPFPMCRWIIPDVSNTVPDVSKDRDNAAEIPLR